MPSCEIKQKKQTQHKALADNMNPYLHPRIQAQEKTKIKKWKGKQSLQEFCVEGPETWSRCSHRALKMSLSLPILKHLVLYEMNCCAKEMQTRNGICDFDECLLIFLIWQDLRRELYKLLRSIGFDEEQQKQRNGQSTWCWGPPSCFTA